MAGNGISYPGNGVSFIPGTDVPSDGAVVIDGTAATLTKEDGSGNLGAVVIDVAGGAVTGVALAHNYATVADGDDGDLVSDQAGHTAAMQISVANNVATFQFSNATESIAINSAPTTVKTATGNASASAAFAVAGGDVTQVTLAATAAVISDGDPISIQIQSGASSVGGTFNYQTSQPRARLPAGASFVSNGVGLQVPVTGTFASTITPQVNASGVITGFTLS